MAKYFTFWLILILVAGNIQTYGQIALETPNAESILFLGKGKKQKLVVGFGGSEGGNAWSSDYWKKTRDQFIEMGYAFLAVGYFGAKGTPDTLNKIAIDDVHQAIQIAKKNKQIKKGTVAIIGGSRGADLALLLGSYYKDIGCVISIVGSNAVFPGHTQHFSTPCFTHKKEYLPFVPVNNEAVPFIMKGNLRAAFETMLKDTASVERAAIRVERIKGPVLFLSATKDQICPSTPMADRMMERLKNHHFKHYYEHKAFTGYHGEPLKHFDLIFDFLDKYFK